MVTICRTPNCPNKDKEILVEQQVDSSWCAGCEKEITDKR